MRRQTSRPGPDPVQRVDPAAAQVAGATARQSPQPAPSLQRRAGNAAVARSTAVQRSPVQDVLSSAGRPLEPAVRAEMEVRLGADLGSVRMHRGPAAETSAAAVGARAYTSGEHVVIGAGGGDRHTLAHELTHVLQQRQGPVSATPMGNGIAVSDPGDRFERAAEANAHRVLSGPLPAGKHAEHVSPAPAVRGVVQRRASAASRATTRVRAVRADAAFAGLATAVADELEARLIGQLATEPVAQAEFGRAMSLQTDPSVADVLRILDLSIPVGNDVRYAAVDRQGAFEFHRTISRDAHLTTPTVSIAGVTAIDLLRQLLVMPVDRFSRDHYTLQYGQGTDRASAHIYFGEGEVSPQQRAAFERKLAGRITADDMDIRLAGLERRMTDWKADLVRRASEFINDPWPVWRVTEWRSTLS